MRIFPKSCNITSSAQMIKRHSITKIAVKGITCLAISPQGGRLSDMLSVEFLSLCSFRHGTINRKIGSK